MSNALEKARLAREAKETEEKRREKEVSDTFEKAKQEIFEFYEKRSYREEDKPAAEKIFIKYVEQLNALQGDEEILSKANKIAHEFKTVLTVSVRTEEDYRQEENAWERDVNKRLVEAEKAYLRGPLDSEHKSFDDFCRATESHYMHIYSTYAEVQDLINRFSKQYYEFREKVRKANPEEYKALLEECRQKEEENKDMHALNAFERDYKELQTPQSAAAFGVAGVAHGKKWKYRRDHYTWGSIVEALLVAKSLKRSDVCEALAYCYENGLGGNGADLRKAAKYSKKAEKFKKKGL